MSAAADVFSSERGRAGLPPMFTGRTRKEKRTMLKGIPKILSPELLMVLAEMGHSDRLVIGDGNFPAESM